MPAYFALRLEFVPLWLLSSCLGQLVLTVPVAGCDEWLCSYLEHLPVPSGPTLVFTPFTEMVFKIYNSLDLTDTQTLGVASCFCEGFQGSSMIRTVLKEPFLPLSSSIKELDSCLRNLLLVSLIFQKTYQVGKWSWDPAFFVGTTLQWRDALTLLWPLLCWRSGISNSHPQNPTASQYLGNREHECLLQVTSREKRSYGYYLAVHHFQTMTVNFFKCVDKTDHTCLPLLLPIPSPLPAFS